MAMEIWFIFFVAFTGPLKKSTTYASKLTCPNSLILRGSHCYIHYDTKVSYQVATDSCKLLVGNKAKLAEPRSASMDTEIAYFSTNNTVWIGAHDRLKERTFRWESDGSPVTWFDWVNSKNSDDKDCVKIDAGGWKHSNCHEKTSTYLCQIDPFKKYGDSCTNKKQCVNYMECRNDGSGLKCLCATNRYLSEERCPFRKTDGKGCDEDRECASGMGCYSKKCRCHANRYFSGGHCELRKAEGEICEEDEECSSESRCKLRVASKQCQCKIHKNINVGFSTCMKFHGDGCSEDDDCVFGMVCAWFRLYKQCLCDSNRYLSEGQCIVKKNHADTCTKHEECASGMRCIWSNYIKLCQCNTNRYVSGSQCLLRKSHGDRCTKDEECYNTLECRQKGSDRRCLCSQDEYFYESKCKPIKQYGGICDQDVECIKGTKCTTFDQHYIKRCRFDLKQHFNQRCFNTLDCVEGLQCKSDGETLLCLPSEISLMIIFIIVACVATVVGFILYKIHAKHMRDQSTKRAEAVKAEEESIKSSKPDILTPKDDDSSIVSSTSSERRTWHYDIGLDLD